MSAAASVFDELAFQPSLPEDHDPLADGILMAHQVAWIEDTSPLKIAAKGRRTGITYAEALDDAIIAATGKLGDGDNIFYIPDTKDKGLVFIQYIAHFARIVGQELGATYEEYLFEDKKENGESKFITAWRVRFASGHMVVALSSRPENIRGLQGIVVIDEAAFHQDVDAVLDAVNALLIWGGKIRIISSHNGEDNPFNQLIKDTKAGLYDYTIHHIPFSLAVKNGLYNRVCLMRGWEATEEGFREWLAKITRSYGPRHEARDEELEAIPRKSSGVYLPRALVEKAQRPGIPIVQWSCAENFYLDEGRLLFGKSWLNQHIAPLLALLDPLKRTIFGQDFGRDGDLSVIVVAQEEEREHWAVAFQIELRRVPFDVQELVLFFVLDRLPRFRGKLDARGNGQSHAEKAQQKYGPARIECVKATAAWYALYFPKYKSALEDGSFILPAGEDVVADHRLVVLQNGFPTMSDRHVQGADGESRHGDSVIAALLAHATTDEDIVEYGYEGVGPGTRAYTSDGRRRSTYHDDDDDDGFGGGMLPRLRGGL